MMKNTLTSKTSFSLIELMVVMAILGVLASLLIPSLKKTLQVSETLNCKQQMRGLATVANLYFNDAADGALMWASDKSNPSIAWYKWYSWPVVFARAGYFDSITVNVDRYQQIPTTESPYYCPSNPIEANFSVGERAHASYAFNLYGYTKNIDGIKQGFLNAFPESDVYFSLQKVLNPAGTILFSEAMSPWMWSTYKKLQQHNLFAPWTSMIWLKHINYTANALYADGHLDQLENQDFKTQFHSSMKDPILGEAGENL